MKLANLTKYEMKINYISESGYTSIIFLNISSNGLGKEERYIEPEIISFKRNVDVKDLRMKINKFRKYMQNYLIELYTNDYNDELYA